MKVVFLNMSSQFEWDYGIRNRNKHILNEFAKRDDIEEILSVDFLPYNFKSLIRLIVKSKLHRKEKDLPRNLFYKTRRINNKIISLSATSIYQVKRVIKKLNFKDAIVLNYSPFNVKQFTVLKNHPQYFDTVDNWIENKTFEKQKQKLKENYRTIIRNSRCIFARPQKLKDDLIRIGYAEQYTDTAKVCTDIKDNIYIVKNGVDIEHFKNPKQLETIDNIFSKIDNKYKTIVGYVGVLKSDRIDLDLLEYIVTNNPDKMFVIAGPIMDGFDISRFKKLENVMFPGKMSYDEMSTIYSKFDICIIPHLLNDFIKSMDPMKLYEYLAAGKPVVSVGVPGTEDFNNVIKIANSKTDFDFFIKDIADNIEEYHSQKYIDERRNAVEGFSWKNKANEMMEIIKKDLNF